MGTKRKIIVKYDPLKLASKAELRQEILSLRTKVASRDAALDTKRHRVDVGFIPDLYRQISDWTKIAEGQQRRLGEIEDIIRAVENRCMAADGNVTPTLEEMTESELRKIYKLAHGLRR